MTDARRHHSGRHPTDANPDGGLDAVQRRGASSTTRWPMVRRRPTCRRRRSTWLAEQRFVHGLLRALHTADPAARERGSPASSNASTSTNGRATARRHWLLVAAAALLLAVFGIWWSLPASLPTAEAAVQRAAEQLARDVDRRFRVVASARPSAAANCAATSSRWWCGPAAASASTASSASAASPSASCTPGATATSCGSRPATACSATPVRWPNANACSSASARCSTSATSTSSELVRKLPADFELRVVGRQLDADGRTQLRHRGGVGARRPARQAALGAAECDEATGMVTRLDVECAGPSPAVRRRSELRYLGEEPPGLVDYQRPW